MNMIYVDKPDGALSSIFKKAYPEYKGRKLRVTTTKSVDVRSYWSEGSRDFFKFVNLDSLAVSGSIPAQSAFDRPLNGAEHVPLQDNWACVMHRIFCGKDMGLTLYIAPENANALLPFPADELTEGERIVLRYTRSLKSSYGGIKNLRFHTATNETGISLDEWNESKEHLIARKLLTSAGVITAAGKNALSLTQA